MRRNNKQKTKKKKKTRGEKEREYRRNANVPRAMGAREGGGIGCSERGEGGGAGGRRKRDA